MKNQNTFLFLTIASAVVPATLLPSSLMPLNQYKGVSDELRVNADSVDKARISHAKVAQAHKNAVDLEQTSEFKNFEGPTKTAVRNVRLQLGTMKNSHKKYLDDTQRLSARVAKTTELFEKHNKTESAEFQRLSDKKEQALAYEKFERPAGNVMSPVALKKSKEARSRKMVGGNPATWTPRITVDRSTGITYIQTYDKNGDLGAKKVYRNHKQTAAYGTNSDTIFEDFENDIRNDVKNVERTF